MKLPKKVVNEEEANTIRLLLANWIIETIIATMYVLMKVYDQIANNIFFFTNIEKTILEDEKENKWFK